MYAFPFNLQRVYNHFSQELEEDEEQRFAAEHSMAVSSFYLNNVNAFGNCGGFDNILDRFAAHKSGSRPLSVDLVHALIKPVSKVRCKLLLSVLVLLPLSLFVQPMFCHF